MASTSSRIWIVGVIGDRQFNMVQEIGNIGADCVGIQANNLMVSMQNSAFWKIREDAVGVATTIRLDSADCEPRSSRPIPQHARNRFARKLAVRVKGEIGQQRRSLLRLELGNLTARNVNGRSAKQLYSARGDHLFTRAKIPDIWSNRSLCCNTTRPIHTESNFEVSTDL